MINTACLRCMRFWIVTAPPTAPKPHQVENVTCRLRQSTQADWARQLAFGIPPKAHPPSSKRRLRTMSSPGREATSPGKVLPRRKRPGHDEPRTVLLVQPGLTPRQELN